MKIGTKLRRIRELRGMKQEAMSTLLGITQAAYSKIENDEVDISLSRLSQIAEKLECKEEDILSFDEKYVFNNCTNAGYQPQYTSNPLERTFLEEILHSKDELLKTKELYIESLQKQIELMGSRI